MKDILLASVGALLLTACGNETTGDRVGEELDEAAEEIGEAFDAARDEAADAVDDAAGKIEDALDELEDET